MWLVWYRCLQRFDRPPGPLPRVPSLFIPAVEHEVFEAGGLKLGIVAVLLN